MKKILVLFALAVLFFSAVFVAATVASNYNPETGKIKITLQKGWNMIPNVPQYANDPNFSNTCEDSLRAAYFYSPVQNKYLGSYYSGGTAVYVPPNAREIVDAEKASMYYHAFAGGMFVYTSKNCSFESSIGSSTPLSDFPWTVKQGWNFITIMPWMLGDNMQNIFADCDVAASNYWDEINQKWVYSSIGEYTAQTITNSVQEITNDAVGLVVVVKLGSDCKLRVGGTPLIPPAIPT